MLDLGDFEFADIDQWEQQVIKDLGLDHIREITEIVLSPEITQSPYVDFTSYSEIKHISNSLPSPEPHSSWQGNRVWHNMVHIASGGAELSNRQAHEALSGGADGVIFELEGIENYQTLLADISVPHCFIGLEGPLEAILRLLNSLSANQLALNGFAAFPALDISDKEIEKLEPLLNLSDNFNALVIRKSVDQHGTLQEIVELLVHTLGLVEKLGRAGIPPQVVFENIQYELEISKNYLWEICRLRCLRILHHKISSGYLPSEKPEPTIIRAVCSSTDEEHEPLIGLTTRAMSAILGGSHMLTVRPVDDANQAVQRNARNVSNLLREESFFHHIADPVAGSYYLDDLTNKMMHTVWNQVKILDGRLTDLSIETPTTQPSQQTSTSSVGPEAAHNMRFAAGIPPFLRGPYSTMYVSRPWTIRQYAGIFNRRRIQRILQAQFGVWSERLVGGIRPAHTSGIRL